MTHLTNLNKVKLWLLNILSFLFFDKKKSKVSSFFPVGYKEIRKQSHIAKLESISNLIYSMSDLYCL